MPVLDPLLSSTVIYGSLFGLMCVGLTLTYLTTKVPNFAYASFVIIGIYTSFTLYWLAGFRNFPYLTVPFAFLTGGSAALGMYLLVLRPLTKRGSSLVSLMIATFAVDIVAVGALLAYEDYLQGRFHTSLGPDGFSPYRVFPLGHDFSIGGVQALVVIAPAILVGVTLSLYFLLTKTKFGIAMRAAIENPSLATVLGINVGAVYVVSWFLAGGIAAIAGTPWVMIYGAGSNTEGELIVTIFAGSVLGGLTSLFGAVIGGFIVGGGETFITTWLSQLIGHLTTGAIGSQVVGFQKAIPLIIMMATLLFIPQGFASVDWRNLGKSRRSRIGVTALHAGLIVALSLQFLSTGVSPVFIGWTTAVGVIMVTSVAWVKRRTGVWVYRF